MRFGARIIEQSHPAWKESYLPYEQLKSILHRIHADEKDERFRAEGDFLTVLLRSLSSVDLFYAERERRSRFLSLSYPLYIPTRVREPAVECARAFDAPRPPRGLSSSLYMPHRALAARSSPHHPIHARHLATARTRAAAAAAPLSLRFAND